MAPNERRRQRFACAADILATGRNTRQRLLQPAEAAGSDGIVASLDADNQIGSQAASCGGVVLAGSAAAMHAAAAATTQDGGVPMAASQTLARPGSQRNSQPGGEAGNANQRPSMLCRHGRTLQTIAGSPEPQPGSQSQNSEPPMHGSSGSNDSQQQGELFDGVSPLHGDPAAAAAGQTDADADADDADAAAGTQGLHGSPPQQLMVGTPARPCNSLAATRRILSSPLQLGWGRNPLQEAPHSPTHSTCSMDAAESDSDDGQEGVLPTQPVPPELFPPESVVLPPSSPTQQGAGRSQASQRSYAATGSQAGGAAGPPQRAFGFSAQSAFGALFQRPAVSAMWLLRSSRQQQAQHEPRAAHAVADTEAAAQTAEAAAHQRGEAAQEDAAEAGEARAEQAAEAAEALRHDMLEVYTEHMAEVEEAMQEAQAEAGWEDEADMAEAEEEDAADFAEAEAEEAADAEEAAAAEAADAAELPAVFDATYVAGRGWLPPSLAEVAGAAVAAAAEMAGAAAPTAVARAAGSPAAMTGGGARGRRVSDQYLFPRPTDGGTWRNPTSPLYRASSNGYSGYLDYDVFGSQDTADRAADEEAELRSSPEPEDRTREAAATDAAVRRAASAKEEAMLRDADRAAEEHWRAHQEEQEQMEWAIRTAERDAGEASDDEHSAEHRQEAAMLRRAARLLEGSDGAAAPSPAELDTIEAAGLAMLRRCAGARRQLQAAEAAAAAEQADEVAELRGRLTAAESQLKLAQVDAVNLTGQVNWWQDRADATASANRQLQAQLDQAEAREQDANCAVCYVAARNASLLPCMHRFCIGCIRQHMSLSGAGASNCPLCRTRIRSVLEDI